MTIIEGLENFLLKSIKKDQSSIIKTIDLLLKYSSNILLVSMAIDNLLRKRMIARKYDENSNEILIIL